MIFNKNKHMSSHIANLALPNIANARSEAPDIANIAHPFRGAIMLGPPGPPSLLAGEWL